MSEIEYPQMGDVSPLQFSGEVLPEYIIYIVQLLIVFAGLVSIISIVGGGLLWLSSRGDPEKIKEGKERFSNAIFGFIIVLSSFVFLSSIDPDLTNVDNPDVKDTEESFPSGIYLSRTTSFPEEIEDLKQETEKITNSIRNLEELGEDIKSLLIANQTNNQGEVTDYYYAVLVHEKRGFRGRCELFVNNSGQPRSFDLSGENISSITVVQVNKNAPNSGKLVAYSRPDFREDYPHESLNTALSRLTSLSIPGVWSIDIKGDFAVVLASGDSWENTDNGCGVFLDSSPIPDLKGHHMNQCNPRKVMPIYAAYDSCATHYVAFPLFR